MPAFDGVVPPPEAYSWDEIEKGLAAWLDRGAGKPAGVARHERRVRRRSVDQMVAERLISGGMLHDDVYKSGERVVFDVATRGEVSESIGRALRGNPLYCQPNAAKAAKISAEYRAYIEARAPDGDLTALCVRPDDSVVNVRAVRSSHRLFRRKLNNVLRSLVRKGLFESDAVGTHVASVSTPDEIEKYLRPCGELIDIHFHLIGHLLGDIDDVEKIFKKHHFNMWVAKDRARNPEVVQDVGSAAGYLLEEDPLADRVRDDLMGNGNLVILYRQLKGLSLTCRLGRFRVWCSNLKKDGMTAEENVDGTVSQVLQCKPRRYRQLRRHLVSTTSEARVLKQVVFDFGTGEWRIGIVVEKAGSWKAIEAAGYRMDYLVQVAQAAISGQCKVLRDEPLYLATISTSAIIDELLGPPPRPPDP